MNRQDKEDRKLAKIAAMNPTQLADYVREHSYLNEITMEAVIRRMVENQARIWRWLEYV